MKDTLKRRFPLPFRNTRFIGRNSHLESLEQRILAEGRSQRIAIAGLGGVGKTRIALEIAHRIQETFPDFAVFWVLATDSSAFEQAYLKIGQKLEIPGINDSKADVKQLVRDELSRDTSGRWLMIVDNTDDINIFSRDDADRAFPLDFYLPQNSQGTILFTSRNEAIAIDLVGDQAGDDVLDVEKMDLIDARKLLESHLVRKHLIDNEQAAIELLETLLACLPLAIVQSAAYMNKRIMPISRYVTLFKQSEDTMISLLSEDFKAYRSTKDPVATTWLISFNQIKRDDPLAADYLSFMSCVNRQDIPGSILPQSRELEKENALGTLKAYWFITVRTASPDGGETYDVHQLVHLATRNWLRADQEIEGHLTIWSERVLTRLAEIFPEGTHENRAKWTSYLPHARCILESQHLPKRSEKFQWTLLFNVAWCLRSNGDYKAAAIMASRDLDLREMALGSEDRETLSSVHNLAVVLDYQGKYAEAEQMSRRALSGREAAVGKEHPDTLTTISHLAWVLGNQGKYDEAERLDRRALEGRVKLGALREDTLTSVNNLAAVLTSRARYRDAEQIQRRALDGRQQVLGPLHPDTLTSIEGLAWILERQSDHAAAESLNRQALEGRRQTLGLQHPDTLTSMSKLALVLQSQGKYKAAKEMNRRVLRDRKQILGSRHPDTFTSISSLAALLYYEGNYDEAKSMWQEALVSVKETLGFKHPLTLRIASDLAGLLQRQGKLDEAEKMNQEVLTLYRENLGPDHPYTLTSMSNLAEILQEQHRHEEAEDLHRQALEGRKSLDPEHPNTLASMSNLASLLVRQQKYDETETLHRGALDGYERKFGPDHVDTLTSVFHIAHLLHVQGHYDDAVGFYEQAGAGFEKELGHKHPTTQKCARYHAKMLEKMDDAIRLRQDASGETGRDTRRYGAVATTWRAAFAKAIDENTPTVSQIDWSVD